MKKDRVLGVMVVVLAAAIAVCAAQAAPPAELTTLRDAYEAAQKKQLDPLKVKYHASLADLRERLTKAGDLDGALAVRAIEQGKQPEDGTEVPAALSRLQQTYASASGRISADLQKKYTVALQKLQAKLTREGNLDGALVVRQEVRDSLAQSGSASVKEDSPKVDPLPKNQEDFEKYIVGTRWSFKDEQHEAYTFTADGKFANQHRSLPFEVTDLRNVTIVWSSDTRVKCEISRDFQKLQELNGSKGTLYRVPDEAPVKEVESSEDGADKKPLFELD